ncbi:MAG TPA: DnaB-like helicase C-terminal domain-containing protein, partial [Candidatus Hodarchaeales archaeon]|nr:DnaB-like helicase C-terminal domain-containing protein [Candidatus Hodarchaeales archaeon]
IKVCEKVLTVPEIIARAAKIENLGLIGIDFADLLVSGEVTEPAMAVIYKSLAAAAKQLNVPIILLSQFSRNYQGGIPRPYHIRYTSLAEALSWMIIALYSPTLDYFANEKRKGDPELPIIPGKAYMIAWKCRGGFRVHGGPGAVQLRWDGGLSWGNTEGNWFDLTKGHKNSKADEEDDEDWSEYEDD